MIIEKHIDYFSGLWRECSSSYPLLETKYTSQEQQIKEFHFEKIIRALKLKNDKNPAGANSSSRHVLSTTALFRELFTSVFGFENGQLDLILSPQFKLATKKFIKMGRDFNPDLDLTDIFQACRNAWIMNSIQLMFGLPVEITPSIFAYSMLYPYSDNYLDDPEIPQAVKIKFSRHFRQRLMGEEVQPDNTHERQIFDLVGMIETQFARSEFPKVYNSLLAIHSAQTKSLSLVKPTVSMSETDVLKLCIEKGGTSVLADGYLVAGDLTEAQERFFFGYGAYLQFIDDIQDIKEDSCVGQLTIFSHASKKYSLDALTNKTFHFGEKALGLLNVLEGKNLPAFKKLIKKSIDSMLVETILLNEDFYTKTYIEELESYSPLSISCLKKRRGKLSPNRVSYMKKIMKSIVAEL
ncbi:hypothetical protein MNBD_BACTEROID01-2005 [hydrothermal vent metagenome]|uniref:Uncharacterized protein n=1 Tax=hydrothermal vent metagenome TaxID=652676 RepID=A0A3B0TUD5_9ZZZZ